MGGNPKASPWRSTSQERRKRPKVQVSLSADLILALDVEAARSGRSKSEIVEDALRAFLNA